MPGTPSADHMRVRSGGSSARISSRTRDNDTSTPGGRQGERQGRTRGDNASVPQKTKERCPPRSSHGNVTHVLGYEARKLTPSVRSTASRPLIRRQGDARAGEPVRSAGRFFSPFASPSPRSARPGCFVLFGLIQVSVRPKILLRLLQRQPGTTNLVRILRWTHSHSPPRRRISLEYWRLCAPQIALFPHEAPSPGASPPALATTWPFRAACLET